MAKTIREFLRKEGLPTDQLDAWELITAEAGNNAVFYARGDQALLPIEFAVELTAQHTELRVTDHTPGFEMPESIEAPDPLAEGGRGLFLMSSLSDSLDYRRGRHGNCMVIRKYHSGESPLKTSPAPRSSAQDESLEATLQTMTEELAASYESLSVIFRFTEDLNRSEVNDAFIARWLAELKAITSADWFILRLLDAERQDLIVSHTSDPGPRLRPLALHPGAASPLSVETQAAQQKCDVWFDPAEPGMTNDPLGDFGPNLSGLVHPLDVGGEIIGVLSIGRFGPANPFSAGQVNIIHTVADFLGLQIRNAQFQKARVRAQLIDREYEVASQIQRGLLPKSHPSIGAWRTEAYCQSAQRVGGDFYDVIPIGTGGLLLAVADVMGKGLPAALFAAVFRSLLHARLDLAPTPGRFLDWLNANLLRDLSELDMFITAQLVFVDTLTREVRAAGAGHPPLLLAGRHLASVEVPSEGPPLGIIEGIDFAESRLPLPPAARILMYTDGVSETTNAGGEQAGVVPLRTLLDQAVLREESGARTLQELNAWLKSFSDDRPAADDRTVILLVEQPVAAPPPPPTP